MKVSPPTRRGDRPGSGGDTVLVGFLAPRTRPDVLEALAGAGATAFAMEAIPRISRAQSMDALSSQSNVAGYKAVLVAATEHRPLLPDADDRGGHDPAGEGARAGRRASRGCRRSRPRGASGAVVTGYDVRSAVAEQVQSLGATFLELEAGKGAEGEGGYARELTEEEREAQQQRADRGDHGLRRRHHDRAGARAARRRGS